MKSPGPAPAAVLLAALACEAPAPPAPSPPLPAPAPAATAPVASTAPGPRPDVVLVILDCVRYDHSSLSGYGRDTTPALAQLAAMPGAVHFPTTWAGASWSVPSQMTLLTGRFADRHGVDLGQRSLPAEIPTFAEVLRAYGYRTAAFTRGTTFIADTGGIRGFDQVYNELAWLGIDGAVDQALAWLAKSPGPSFAVVHGYDAHLPYAATGGDPERFDPGYRGPVHDDPEFRAAVARGGVHDDRVWLDPPGAPGLLAPGTAPAEGRSVPLAEADRAHLVAHYDASVRQADAGLGKLLDGLGALGRLDGALLWVVGDHGDALAEGGGSFGPGRPGNDALLRVPMVARLPCAEAPATAAGVSSLADVLPSTLAFLGATPPAGTDGVDLWTGGPGCGRRLAAAAGRKVRAWSIDGAALRTAEAMAWVDPRGAWRLTHPPDAEDLAAGAPEELARMIADLPADPRAQQRAEVADPALRRAMQEQGYFTPGPAPGDGRGPVGPPLP